MKKKQEMFIDKTIYSTWTKTNQPVATSINPRHNTLYIFPIIMLGKSNLLWLLLMPYGSLHNQQIHSKPSFFYSKSYFGQINCSGYILPEAY